MKTKMINGVKHKQCSKFKKGLCVHELSNSNDGYLPLSEFHVNVKCKNSQNPKGHTPQCRACDTKRTTDWYKKYPAKANAIAQKWRDNHPIKTKRVRQEYAKRNPDIVRERVWAQNEILNLDGSPFKMVDYQIKLKKAHNQCECCGTEDKLGIDHNHQTDYARGILCYKCNLNLGAVEIALAKKTKLPKFPKIKKLLSYLKKYPY